MAKLPATKPDYNLSIRYRLRNGEWGEWKDRGYGKFESIEIVQRQIRLLASAYQGRDKEVRFERDGELYDFNGQLTGKVIELPNR
jgi:hypothetical protein